MDVLINGTQKMLLARLYLNAEAWIELPCIMNVKIYAMKLLLLINID